MKFKWRIIFSVLMLCLLTLSACSSNNSSSNSGSSDTNNPKEIRIGYQVIPNEELLAKSLGLVEKKFPDINIKWIQFDSGKDVNTAMAAKSLDIALVGSTGAATGIAQNLPYYVYVIHDIEGENESLVVRKNAGIKSIKDLSGKKVAVPFGTTTHYSLLSVLDREKVDLSKVKILDMTPADMYAAWQRKDIDAGYVWQPTLQKMKDENGEILVTSKQLAEEGIVTADIGVVSKDFANKYPGLLKSYVSVLNEAEKYYRKNPDQAAQAMGKEIGISVNETKKMMSELIWVNPLDQTDKKYLGTSDSVGDFAKVLKDTGDFMVEQKAIPSAPDLNVYQESVLTKALQ